MGHQVGRLTRCLWSIQCFKDSVKRRAVEVAKKTLVYPVPDLDSRFAGKGVAAPTKHFLLAIAKLEKFANPLSQFRDMFRGHLPMTFLFIFWRSAFASVLAM